MKRLMMFVIASVLLTIQSLCVGGPVPNWPQTRYEALEELFKKEVRYFKINFYERKVSGTNSLLRREYHFTAEVSETGETVLEFSNIAATNYDVSVYAYGEEQNEPIFHGRQKIDVLPGPHAVTEARISLELYRNQKFSFQISIDLGPEDKDNLRARVYYLDSEGSHTFGYWSTEILVSYDASEKALKPFCLWPSVQTSKIVLKLLDYGVGAEIDLDWSAREGLPFELQLGPTQDVDLKAGFLSERETGRVFVVPVDFSTIQEAIDASSAGDLIRVWSGATYYERLELKPGIELVGDRTQIRSWEGTAIKGSGGQENVWARIEGFDIGISSGQDQGPVLLFDPNFNVIIDHCLIVGSQGQTLIRAVYSSCQLRNCTLSGADVGMESLYSHENKVEKSLFLNLRSPIALVGADCELDSVSIFWGCQNLPIGARVEDPLLYERSFWPKSNSPCQLEEIGVYYGY